MKYFSNNQNTLSIFLFHGVIEKKNKGIRNYNLKHIEKKSFLKIIKFLKLKGECLSIDQIYEIIKNKKKFPENSFAITFDDGFENNYKVAVPMLKKYNLKSTFYFSSELVDKNVMSWIDKVEYAFQKTNKKKLLLPWEKKLSNINDNKNKILVLDKIRKVLKNKNNNKLIEQFVKNLFRNLNVKEISSLNNNLDKKISWSNVKKLNKSDLFTIGGHSHKHVSLTSIPFDQAKKQIDISLKLFKKKAGIDLKHYSYPEGQRRDFNNNIIKYLKKKGIKICPSAIHGYNNNRSNLFTLKRISINV